MTLGRMVHNVRARDIREGELGKDGPSSMRPVFGFQASRTAGVPYVPHSSGARLNLDALLRRRPDLAAGIRARLAEGERSDSLLRELQEAGEDGKYCSEVARERPGSEFYRARYGDDAAVLRQEILNGTAVGIYDWARLWGKTSEPFQWEVLEEWPAEGAGG